MPDLFVGHPRLPSRQASPNVRPARSLARAVDRVWSVIVKSERTMRACNKVWCG